MPETKDEWLLAVMRNDSEFLAMMGIEPCVLDDPFPRRPSRCKPDAPKIPALTRYDERWLSSCGAAWEPEPEPEFRPLATSLEYVAKYPDRIKATVEETFKDLLIELPKGRTFEDFLQLVIADFVEGAKEGDDLARMYADCRPPEPGACKSAHFHALVRHWVEGVAMTLYPPPIPGLDADFDRGEQMGKKECASCNGTGKCPQCKGTGRLGYPGYGQVDGYRTPCIACQQSGVCRACRGTGQR